MAEVEIITIINAIPSLIEQLNKAFLELELYKDSTFDKVRLKEIEEHFRNLETLMVNKFLELGIRENAFKGEQADAQMLIASRETDVADKEQDLLDRIQELKDAAVAAINEAQLNHPTASLEVDVGDSRGGQVTGSLGDKNSLDNVLEENSPSKTAENAEGSSREVKLRPELVHLCEQMDAKGLLSFVTENKKDILSSSEELILALESALEPGRLVLTTVECCYLPHDIDQEANKNDSALQGLRRSCLMFIKALATLLAKADPSTDNLLNPEIKQQAKAIADQWKPKLANPCNTAASNTLEAEAFLQLLATFRIASEFDEDELCKLVLTIARNRQAPELCRALGLAEKVPGLIETLINSRRQMDAACFINAFQLRERFPIVPLLEEYLENSKRVNQGKDDDSGAADEIEKGSVARELAALKKIMFCVKDYSLEVEYPLDPLQKRVAELEKSKNEKKRPSESSKKQQSKKQRGHGRPYGFGTPAPNPGRPAPSVYGDRAAYPGIPERYPPAYNYQVPQQPPIYPQQAYDQTAYYYPQDGRVANTSYNAAPSTYTNHQPYM